MITGFTDLFRTKWRKQYGSEPKVEDIIELLRNSIKINPQQTVQNPYTGKVLKMLAVYWIPDSSLVLKIDVESNSCVTLFSKLDDTKAGL